MCGGGGGGGGGREGLITTVPVGQISMTRYLDFGPWYPDSQTFLELGQGGKH